MKLPERLAALTDFYESLTPQSLARLPEFYAEDARFSDPFNDVTGHAAIAHIFADMFEKLDSPRFEVTGRYVPTAESFPDEAVLRWVMRFRSRLLGPGEHVIEGTSRLRFAADGRVTEHQDFWDGSALLARLPWIGAPLRALRRRLAAGNQSTASL